MSEHSFDIEGIEPAKASFIENSTTVSDEKLPDGTPAPESAAPAEQPAPVPAPAESDEKYKNLQAAFTKATQDNSELRNRLVNLEDRLAQQPAPTNQDNFDLSAQQPPKPDELDKTVEDYAELSPFAARIKQLEAQLLQQKSSMDRSQEDQARVQQQNARQAHEQKIMSVHADAFQIAATPDFKGWVARQPRYIQVAVQEGSAEELIDVFTAYKGTPTMTDVANQIANPPVGSAVIKNTDPTKPTFTGAQIAEMSYEEFIRREPEIQLAQMEGRVTT